MSTMLVTLKHDQQVDFISLFDPVEGRAGVTVTFLAMLELLKESLIDVVQSEPFGPIQIRAARQHAHAEAPTPQESERA
jgi:segregation and condensation protein A